MKNKLWIFLILIIVIGIGVGIYFFVRNNNSKTDYIASKTSIGENSSSSDAYIQNNIKETNSIELNQNTTNNEQKTEEEISSFSTKIYTKETGRQNNITITCGTLNETIVPNDSTFSFCDTVGQATTAKGYQEAEIFDENGNKINGLGGGNCQVSTTLYNAVLKIPSLAVTERHEHSNKVPYIEKGKDAAVAYGSYDFKFRNNTGYDIKIIAQNTADNINIILYKIY